jgi:hypothetical protein
MGQSGAGFLRSHVTSSGGEGVLHGETCPRRKMVTGIFWLAIIAAAGIRPFELAPLSGLRDVEPKKTGSDEPESGRTYRHNRDLGRH